MAKKQSSGLSNVIKIVAVLHGVDWYVFSSCKESKLTFLQSIHEACIRQTTEEVIVSLLESFPEGARATDTYGRLPLHHGKLEHL